MPKIYTKRGDSGKTDVPYIRNSKVKYKREDKCSIFPQVVGSIDSLSVKVGLCTSRIIRGFKKSKYIQDPVIGQRYKQIIDDLTLIMKELYMVNCELYNPLESLITEDMIKTMEDKIDLMTSSLPELKNFILYMGTQESLHVQEAKCLCRDAERLLVKMKIESSEQDETANLVNPNILSYINRLSDMLYTLARYLNYLQHDFGICEYIVKMENNKCSSISVVKDFDDQEK